MPFKSDSQRRFLFSQKPKIAAEFASKTPKGAKLPEKVGKQLSALKRKRKSKHGSDHG